MILSLVCLRENLSKIDFVMLVKKGNKQNQLSNLRMWCLLQGHYNCCTWISLVHQEQKASEVMYTLWLLLMIFLDILGLCFLCRKVMPLKPLTSMQSKSKMHNLKNFVKNMVSVIIFQHLELHNKME